jgi:urease accessory protein
MRKLAVYFAAMVALTGVANAHEGHEVVSGLSSGLLHPLTGVDHMLAMVATGIIAALCGGRMLWAVPAAFVFAMLVGAGAGLAGLTVPAAEMWIIGSVVVLGLVAAMPSARMPQGLLLAGIGLFGLFHGYAHGLEAPLAGSTAEYLLGFTLATAVLHALGILIGHKLPLAATRAIGAAIAIAGASLALMG